jgi:hypothetical protein
MAKPKDAFAIYLTIVLFGMLFLVRCNFSSKSDLTSLQPVANSYHGEVYAGSQTCFNCHQKIYEQHLETPHHNTSQIATKNNVTGDFAVHNNLQLNDSIRYIMTDEGKLFQAAYKDRKLIRKESFDIVIGSGTKGKTYLYWKESKLYQLPVSKLSLGNRWINSPGYTNDKINFDRAVIPNCLECHTTFARNQLPTDFNSNVYVKNEMIFGVDCESCHGPSLQHVKAHTNDLELKTPKYMTSIKSLTQQQQLDACARCHSGLRKPLKMPFTFKTGDNLSSFRMPNYKPIDTTQLDVHGNQYALLTSSKCFTQSDDLNCTTCHNPHKNERGNLSQFSAQCISCHNNFNIHKTPLKGEEKTNCINCHMPLLKSSAIAFKGRDLNDSILTDSITVRTHKIGIYKNLSKQSYESSNK